MEPRIRSTKLAKVRQEVRDAYEAGGTLVEIAEFHGVSIGTVRNELLSQGVTIRGRGRRKGVQDKPAEPVFSVNVLDTPPPVEEPVVEEPGPSLNVDNEDVVILKQIFDGGSE